MVLVVPSSASDLFGCVSFRHTLEEVVLCRDCFGEALAFGGGPQHGPERQSFLDRSPSMVATKGRHIEEGGKDK